MKAQHLLHTGRNLLITSALVAQMWAVKGYPLPTMEQEFRRCERQALAGYSEILLRCESQGEAATGDPTMLLGVTATAIHTCSETHPFNIWPRNAVGTTLVVLPSELEDRPIFTAGLVAVDPPTGTARARLTITLSRLDWFEDYTVEGEQQGDVFLFSLAAQHSEDSLRSHESEALLELTHQQPRTFLYPYTVDFFDAHGQLLDTLSYSAPWTEEVAV